MQIIPAPLRLPFPLLMACLVMLACFSSSLTCRAQEGAGLQSPRPEALTAGSYADGADVAEAERADITAFSMREVAFGLFVLIVAFIGLLVFLPAGLKPGRTSASGADVKWKPAPEERRAFRSRTTASR